jgi:hypothetical protein
MKKCIGVEVSLHAFLISLHFTAVNKSRCPFVGRLGGSQESVWRREKYLALTENQTPITRMSSQWPRIYEYLFL